MANDEKIDFSKFKYKDFHEKNLWENLKQWDIIEI